MDPSALLAGPRRLLDLLVEGYATLNRRLWILLIPIGLDLFFWLGPRILPLRLAEALSSSWQQALQQAPSSLQADPDLITEGVTRLMEWGNHTNLAHLLTVSLIAALIPRLSQVVLPSYAPVTWAPAIGWIVGPLPLLAAAVGLLLWAFYLVPAADLIRGSAESGRAMLRRVGHCWLRMAGFVGILAILGFALILLVGLAISLVSLLSAGLGTITIYLAIAVALGLLLYLYFTPHAVLFSGIGPRRAILYSVHIVRTNPWLSLGFVLLVSLIRVGTVLLWEQLARWPLGVLGSIVGNAYIVSGLAMATLLFYRERLRAWLGEA